MTAQYSLTVYLVGGDRENMQDLTVRLFTDGQRWDEIRKSLVSSYTEKIRFRVGAGAYNLLVSFIHKDEEWRTPFWGFSVPQVPELRLNMTTGGLIFPDQLAKATIIRESIRLARPPLEIAQTFGKARSLLES